MAPSSSKRSRPRTSSLLKRIRKPFARRNNKKKERSESPVSVLDLYLGGNDDEQPILLTSESTNEEEEEQNFHLTVPHSDSLHSPPETSPPPATVRTSNDDQSEGSNLVQHLNAEVSGKTHEPVDAKYDEDVREKDISANETTALGVQVVVQPESPVTEEISVALLESQIPSSVTFKTAEEQGGAERTLQVGSRVSVVGGTYVGSSGIVEKITAKKVFVALDGGKGTRRLNKESISVVEGYAAVPKEEPSLATLATESHTDGDPSNPVPAALKVGDFVLVARGTHKDKSGKIIKETDKMFQVAIPGFRPIRVAKSSVVLHGVSSPASATRALPLSSLTEESREWNAEPAITASAGTDPSHGEPRFSTSTPLQPAASTTLETHHSSSSLQHEPQVVFITGGKHEKHHSGIFVRATAKMVYLLIPSLEKEVRVKISNTSYEGNATLSDDTRPLPWSAGEEWRLPDSAMGGTRFGARVVMKIRLAREGTKRADQNFLTHLLQDRLLLTEVPLNKKEIEEPLDLKVTQEGGLVYELLSSKVQSDGDVGSLQYCTPKCVRLVYAQVSGPQRTPYCLKEELSKLADFASLSTRKVVARLEMLQSPAYQFKKSSTRGQKEPGMFALDKSNFVQLTNEGNDGCGFISEDFLLNLCSRGGAAFAARKLALQVRVVIPTMGIFKGMLMRKRIPSDQPQIQLTPSMRKVGPSEESTDDERAFLWITQQGMHPSENNEQIGRLVDPSAKDPRKSFQPKRVSDDVLLLWRTLQVPESVCDSYARRSARVRGLCHASVVGVADPTNALPPGTVFVTGTKHLSSSQKELFVTRFPCNLPSDGRVIGNVTEQPEGMSEEDWMWLNQLPFGAIVFADAREGTKPLPELVAEGDVDGDLYFVCWDTEILHHIQPEPIEVVPVNPGSASTEALTPDENWLEKAQELMINAAKIQELNELIGKLYSLSSKTAKASNELLMYDPAAMSFARAFKHALQHGKHGGTIPLPRHLHEKVPPRLQKYLA